MLRVLNIVLGLIYHVLDMIFIIHKSDNVQISKQSNFNVYSQIERGCQLQLIIDYKISFQDCKFLICFYSLSN